MIKVSVRVPEDRLADFHVMYGQWLAGDAVPTAATAQNDGGETVDWSDTAEDEPLARVVWSKLSPRAKALFGTLMDHPDERFSGERLAALHNIPNGKYGTAGVLAWPGRHSAAVNRVLPCRYADGPVGESADYWMSPETAALFRRVRDAAEAGR